MFIVTFFYNIHHYNIRETKQEEHLLRFFPVLNLINKQKFNASRVLGRPKQKY